MRPAASRTMVMPAARSRSCRSVPSACAATRAATSGSVASSRPYWRSGVVPMALLVARAEPRVALTPSLLLARGRLAALGERARDAVAGLLEPPLLVLQGARLALEPVGVARPLFGAARNVVAGALRLLDENGCERRQGRRRPVFALGARPLERGLPALAKGTGGEPGLDLGDQGLRQVDREGAPGCSHAHVLRDLHAPEALDLLRALARQGAEQRHLPVIGGGVGLHARWSRLVHRFLSGAGRRRPRRRPA